MKQVMKRMTVMIKIPRNGNEAGLRRGDHPPSPNPNSKPHLKPAPIPNGDLIGALGARCSPKPALIHVGDLIVATLRAHCSTKYTLEKGSNSEHETNENESGSESDQEENEEEDETNEEEKNDEFVRTSSNDSDDEDEAKIADEAEGDEDEEMDFTTSQLYDDVDIRLNEPKTEVSVTSSSHSSHLAAKFLNFSDIPHTIAEIVSSIDVHVHHEVPSKQTPTLPTVHVSVIT
ncbi:hypothetical protein Tco_1053264 [Tanacetum coccineum]